MEALLSSSRLTVEACPAKAAACNAETRQIHHTWRHGKLRKQDHKVKSISGDLCMNMPKSVYIIIFQAQSHYGGKGS